MRTRPYCFISGVIFLAVALLHGTRLFNGWGFVIGPIEMPQALSVVGAILSAALAVWGLSLSRR